MAEEETKLKEDDIRPELLEDRDDELADVKMHVRHAESRISALRARLKNRTPRKSKTTMEFEEFSTGLGNISNTTTTTTTTVTTQSETSVLQAQILELQEKIRKMDEMNLGYQKELEILKGKDGVITKLQLEHDELRIKVSDVDGDLAKNREKAQRLENQVAGIVSDNAELLKLQDDNSILLSNITKKETELKSVNENFNRQAQTLASTDTELVKLRNHNSNISQKLVDLAAGNDDKKINDIREEKRTLHLETVRMDDEILKVREGNLKLEKETAEQQAEIDRLQLLSAEKDGDVVTLNLQTKDLEEVSNKLAGETEQVESVTMEMKKSDMELEKMKRENNQLLDNAGTLNKVAARYKFQGDQKNQEIQQLELKLASFQDSVKGSSIRETELLTKIKSLDQDFHKMQVKYETELRKTDDLKRINGSLSKRLVNLEASSDVDIRELETKLYAQSSKVQTLNGEQEEMRKALIDAKALRVKNENMYNNFKMKYESQKNLGKKNDSNRMLELDLQARITRLQQQNAEKDRQLANANDSEAVKTQELVSVDEQIVQTGVQLTSRQTMLADLQMKLAKQRRDGTKRSEDRAFMHSQNLVRLATELENWRLMTLKNQKTDFETRNELEAQIKSMESREAMVNARDYELNTLNKAIDLSDTAALNQPPAKKQAANFYGIHVTSIVDHRVDDWAKPVYYKHSPPLGDYHNHVYKVDNEPQYILESSLETERRKKELVELRKRKIEDRRPSIS